VATLDTTLEGVRPEGEDSTCGPEGGAAEAILRAVLDLALGQARPGASCRGLTKDIPSCGTDDNIAKGESQLVW
jgi:hypothetical protein